MEFVKVHHKYSEWNENWPKFPISPHMFVEVPFPDGRRSNASKSYLKAAHYIALEG